MYMEKPMKRQIHNSILVLLISLIFTACSTLPRETGILVGQVNIGPLVPVVRDGEAEPTRLPRSMPPGRS